MRTNALILLLLFLASCSPETADTTLKTEKPPAANEGRAQVTRIGIFDDPLAYNGKRGIYLVRDTTTGKEFIGISGVGIAELGSHQVQEGKRSTTHPDER